MGDESAKMQSPPRLRPLLGLVLLMLRAHERQARAARASGDNGAEDVLRFDARAGRQRA